MEKYCLDTSVLVEGWVRLYPKDVFPSIWGKIEEMVADGRVLSPDEVLNELKKQEDDLYRWAKDQRGLFHPLEIDLQIATQEILAVFPRMVESGKSRHQADVFVVALARLTGRTLVTQEAPSVNSSKPKIPNVCKHYGIRCIDLLSLLREQNCNF